MGFFNSVASTYRKHIGKVGGVLKKVGHVAAKVSHFIGQTAPAVSTIAHAVGNATGSQLAHTIGDKVTKVGNINQTFGAPLSHIVGRLGEHMEQNGNLHKFGT